MRTLRSIVEELHGPNPGVLARRSLAAYSVPVIGLIILGVVFAWPLISRLTLSIPATPPFADVSEYVWSTGWVATALSTDKSLFFTDALFVPFGADLRLNTFGLLQGLLAYPITRLLGIVGGYNAVLVLTLLLNGIFGYLLTFHQTKHVQASFISSALFMLSAPILQHIILGRAALGAMWLVAGVVLALSHTMDRPSPRNVLVLAGLLTAALLTDFQIFLFSALWSAVYGTGRLFKDGLGLFTRRRVLAFALAGLTVGVVFALIYAPVFSSQTLSSYREPDLKSMSFYSLHWWDFVTPAAIPYVYGYEFGILTVIAVATFRWRGDYRIWLAGAFFFALLSLGPFLLPSDVPLPFKVFSIFQPLRQFRTPYRLIMPAQIGLMVVAGSALAFWLPRIRSSYLSWSLCGTIVASHLLLAMSLQPFLVQTYPDYAFYHQVALESGPFTLLELPFGVRSGLERIGNGGEVVQYYQHVHGKRLLNGSMARVPNRVFQYYRSQPALTFLSGEPIDVSRSELDANFADVLRWSDTRYVLVHRRLMTGAQLMRFVSFLDGQSGLKQVGEENDLIIYRVPVPSKSF